MKLFILIFALIFSNCNCATVSEENTLITNLLKGYTKTVRPATEMYGTYKMALKQIIGLDEKNQIMTSSSFFSIVWIDQRLAWDPDANSGLTRVNIPIKSIWYPDIMVLNTADTDGYLKVYDSSLAAVSSDGLVYLVLSASSIKTRCAMNVWKFPFDQQKCSIVLGSWVYPKSELDFEPSNASITLDLFTQNPLWELKRIEYRSILSRDRYGEAFEYENEDVYFDLYLKRRPLYFMTNSLIPCLVLNTILLFTFLLPINNQVGMCMTSLMTYSVYSVRISSEIPIQAEYVPLITLYFILSILYTLISFLWHIIKQFMTANKKWPKILMRFGQFLDELPGNLKILFSKMTKCCKMSKVDDTARTEETAIVLEPSEDKKSEEKKEETQLDKNALQKDLVLVSSLKFLSNYDEDDIRIKCCNLMTLFNGESNKCFKCDMCTECDSKTKKDEKKKKEKEKDEIYMANVNYFMMFLMGLALISTIITIWCVISS